MYKWILCISFIIILIIIGNSILISPENIQEDFQESSKLKKVNTKIKKNHIKESNNKDILIDQVNSKELEGNLEHQELDGFEQVNFKAIEDYYSSVIKNWNDKMKEFIVDYLQLDEKKYKDYIALKEEYALDKMKMMEAFHIDLANKGKYDISNNDIAEYQKNVEEELVRTYADKVKELIGDENYNLYRQMLDDFNDRTRQESEDATNYFPIAL